MTGRLLPLGMAMLVLGCAARPPAPSIPVAEARSRMIGLTQVQARACMGPPPLQRSHGTVVLWSYPSVTAASSGPIITDPASVTFHYTPFDGDPLGVSFGGDALGVGEGPAAPAGCMVDVVFDGGKVRVINYVGPNGTLLRQDPECSQLVQLCAK